MLVPLLQSHYENTGLNPVDALRGMYAGYVYIYSSVLSAYLIVLELRVSITCIFSTSTIAKVAVTK